MGENAWINKKRSLAYCEKPRFRISKINLNNSNNGGFCLRDEYQKGMPSIICGMPQKIMSSGF